MKIIILFETCEGQTGKIVDFIADKVRAFGHDVTTFNMADTSAAPSLADADKIILAAPVHERRHPKAFEAAVTASAKDLSNSPTLLLSVSLKAAFPNGLEDAQDYLIEMKMRTGLTTSQDALVAGAIRPGSYDYYQSQILGHVVLEGQNVAITDGIKEFTDWDALATTVESFLNNRTQP